MPFQVCTFSAFNCGDKNEDKQKCKSLFIKNNTYLSTSMSKKNMEIKKTKPTYNSCKDINTNKSNPHC